MQAEEEERREDYHKAQKTGCAIEAPPFTKEERLQPVIALLSVVVLAQVHIGQRAIPFFYIIGNLGALAGGVAMSGFFDRLGHRATVGMSYLAAAGGVGCSHLPPRPAAASG